MCASVCTCGCIGVHACVCMSRAGQTTAVLSLAPDRSHFPSAGAARWMQGALCDSKQHSLWCLYNKHGPISTLPALGLITLLASPEPGGAFEVEKGPRPAWNWPLREELPWCSSDGALPVNNEDADETCPGAGRLAAGEVRAARLTQHRRHALRKPQVVIAQTPQA